MPRLPKRLHPYPACCFYHNHRLYVLIYHGASWFLKKKKKKARTSLRRTLKTFGEPHTQLMFNGHIRAAFDNPALVIRTPPPTAPSSSAKKANNRLLTFTSMAYREGYKRRDAPLLFLSPEGLFHKKKFYTSNNSGTVGGQT